VQEGGSNVVNSFGRSNQRHQQVLETHAHRVCGPLA
jgi:hypothetical protein